MKSNEKPAPKATSPKKPVRKTRKKEVPATPLMASYGSSTSYASSSTRTRRNAAGDITRTDKYKNIEDGLVPFKHSTVGNESSLTIRDTVVLCQKAYYNYAQFRNIIDLMTEFSVSHIYYREGSTKSRKFFEALFKKVNLWGLQDRFFREYFRSGNIFVYRFDAKLNTSEIKKITQTFGTEMKEATAAKSLIPSRYIILNPADIQKTGSISFSTGGYYKILTDYELERLRKPRTEEDKEVLEHLDPEAKKLIKDVRHGNVKLPLDTDKIVAVFYKKQDYEPFSVPMGYPVLADLNFKDEMKRMDMAIARTMQQAILLVTMGAKPEEGGINQKNLLAMQELFQNQSVGRVLIADYTTKAEFIVPDIADLLDAKKYEVVDRDINNGLNNILTGGEKFANQSAKVEVFMARLKHAREAFINEFLLPEIKRIAKELGFKNYPTPYFDEIELKQNFQMNRIYSRLIELGVLTPEEGVLAVSKGRLPDGKSSVESQKEFKKHKEDGLYEPLMGGKQEGTGESGGGDSGREEGTEGIPQESKEVGPIGDGAGIKFHGGASKDNYSLIKLKENMLLAQSVELKIKGQLKKIHKINKLDKSQEEIAGQICDLIVANEEPKNWNKLVLIRKYCKEPTDKNPERIKEIQNIAYEHQIDVYLASILYASKN